MTERQGSFCPAPGCGTPVVIIQSEYEPDLWSGTCPTCGIMFQRTLEPVKVKMKGHV